MVYLIKGCVTFDFIYSIISMESTRCKRKLKRYTINSFLSIIATITAHFQNKKCVQLVQLPVYSRMAVKRVIKVNDLLILRLKENIKKRRRRL